MKLGFVIAFQVFASSINAKVMEINGRSETIFTKVEEISASEAEDEKHIRDVSDTVDVDFTKATNTIESVYDTLTISVPKDEGENHILHVCDVVDAGVNLNKDPNAIESFCDV